MTSDVPPPKVQPSDLDSVSVPSSESVKTAVPVTKVRVPYSDASALKVSQPLLVVLYVPRPLAP